MMKNKLLIAFIVVLIITGLYFLGDHLLTPGYGDDPKNPYDLKLDSLGEIDKDKFCNYISSTIKIDLLQAKAIAVDHNNNIYISGDKKIYKIDREGTLLKELHTIETATALSCYDDQLICGIKDHIEIFDLDGKLISTGKKISDNSYITSLVKIKEYIYVADADAELVYKLNDEGKVSDIYGDSVSAASNLRFVLPSHYFDVAKDPEGFLWIANTGKHKLINLHTSGELRSYWGSSSYDVEGFCGCCNPTHFVIDTEGSFITSEKGIVRIKKYDAAGQFVCAVAGPEHFKKGTDGLDIALDNEQNIYVLEPQAKLIHIFKEK